MGQAQRALLGNISDALAAMSAAQTAFDQPKTPPQLGSDPVCMLILVHLTEIISYRFIESAMTLLLDCSD